jgi:TolA-binding protein
MTSGKSRNSLFCFAAFCFSYTLHAQKSVCDIKIDDDARKAIELFEKEKFSAAQKFYNNAIENHSLNNTLQKADAEYYSLLCAIELENNDAEVMAERFAANYPGSQNVNEAFFQLGKINYNKKKHRQALGYFSKVNKEELGEDERSEYYFKSGYCWLMIDSVDAARKAFYEIKDIDTRYTPAATYFYSHIAYVQKNYETAVEGFNKLKDDETFSPLVPYYIAQSYYNQGKYDDLLSYAPPLIDSVVETRVAEMARMIADAYFRKNQFTEALPYYQRYFDNSKDLKTEDYYQAGYCYYALGNFEKASSLLEKASSGTTSVAQNANYHLGDCYIRLKSKDKALMAFNSASSMDFDARIKEDAMFNYAVLSYELSNQPFNSSIKTLNDYLTRYPDSYRSDEAYNYLVTACLNTHNYQEALNYLGKIKTKDKKIKKAYQRASFFRGLELFNNLQFDESLKAFELSLKYADLDPVIALRSYYWSGETQYRLKNINDALDNYNLFIASEEAKDCPEYVMVPYNIGYCWFNKKAYSSAATWFNKYENAEPVKKDKVMADTYNRLGDCSFVNGKYQDAIGYYTKSIEIGLSDKDYAIFQKGFALGLLNDHNKKISLLNQLNTTMPESNYNDDALYEIGRSYVALQKPEEATKYFNKLLKDYPSSNYVRKSLLQIGLIQYNEGQNNQAIETYKKVVAEYPGTQEARSALTGIKNIYVEMNEVEPYLKYVETLGDYGNVAVSEKDSLMYYAGENSYTSGDCGKAVENFKKYIEKFSDGNFIVNAYFFKGLCDLKSGKKDEALLSFQHVIEKPVNVYTEEALVEASGLEYERKNYRVSLNYYQRLDSIAESEDNVMAARIGEMQSNYYLRNYAPAIETAQKIITKGGLSQETERQARFIMGKSYLNTDQQQKAFEQFKKLATDVKNTEGAEAKYQLALYYYNQNQQEKAEKEIFSFIELNSPHQYWIAKAYILLADIYHNRKNDFQAVNTLQSIIANYDNKDDGIIKEATDKKQLFEEKHQPSKEKEEESEDDSEEGL